MKAVTSKTGRSCQPSTCSREGGGDRRRGSVALSPDEVTRLARFGPCSPTDGLTAFLVRGVAYGVPTNTVVRRQADVNWLLVYHASYGRPGSASAQPEIVYLSGAPARVFPTARVGGDTVVYGDGLTRNPCDPKGRRP